jgi:cytochrome c biogenesis protein CcmG/thiol:disulfide interchange protein DsbE
MTRRTRPLAGLAALALIALAGATALPGCGSSDAEDEATRPPDYAKLLAGSPPPLAKLHAEEAELREGGLAAYEKRIASLRGYPVLANVWASWCVPCREEFPALQRAAARFGKRVAFLGVNSQDGNDTAGTFLRDHPVPYPSYTDPDGEIAESLGPIRGYPNTAFYDANGELVFLKQGPYTGDSELEADIRRYALGESG